MQTLLKGRALAAAGAVLIGITATATTATTASAQRMVFATQKAGTIYYLLGSGFSKMLSEQLKRRVTVQPYSGSSVYLPLIDNGEAALAFSSSLDAGSAFKGEGRTATKNLRLLARIWGLKVAFMVRADAGIKTIKDLKGKRVTTEMKGQRAMGSVMQLMIKAGGLKLSDVKAITVANVGAGTTALIEGNVDATFIAVGIPLVKRANGKIPGGVSYVDMAGGNLSPKYLNGMVAGVYPTTVSPTKRMPEVKAKLETVAFDIYLISSTKTSAKDVKAVLTAVTDQFKALQKAYPPLRRGKVAGFAPANNTLPYHPGAVEFYKSKGMWKDANTKQEATFK